MRPDILFPYFADVDSLKGVGNRIRPALERAMGPYCKDLLLTPPTGLIDRHHTANLATAQNNTVCTLTLTIGTHMPPRRKGQPYRVHAYDHNTELTLTFFQARSDYLTRILPENTQRIISGKLERFQGQWQMTHPDYILPPEQAAELPLYEPLYPLSAGLSQKVARKIILQALQRVPELPEWLDETLKNQYEWPSFHTALKQIHTPTQPESVDVKGRARTRLAYDELFARQLAMALIREQTRRQLGQKFITSGTLVTQVVQHAPFEPTQAQRRCYGEIQTDLKSPFQMARLLQGDVGAGKTFVAALVCAYMVEAKKQVAFMAPTEILARQHANTLKQYLAPAGIKVQALTARDKGKARTIILNALANADINILVGTHALFQTQVKFHDLGLVIIDEQHRFGVRDRLRLREKGYRPDMLIMSATPIPRTLALTHYADLDISILDEKPAERKPVDTRIFPMQRLPDIIMAMHRALQAGQQAYWICPLVEDSEAIVLTSVEARFAQLKKHFGDQVGLVHGRMKAQDKDNISQAFKAGEYKVLVATTIVEIGMDTPDATIIVIEHAEHFGLAQLHQLRGRVGRSDKPSTCLLLYKAPLSATARTRLETIRSSEDGFFIAEKDWELRGSGDILGTDQSGFPSFKLVDPSAHKALFQLALKDARYFAQKDSTLTTQRGQAARLLLYLFEQDYGITLMRAG